ncbi:trypsin, alkaline C-like [Spodoptera litura]|uniref:Trypsin, alkaline C-like n=1 Tax=Spodoptera litura TaxID=69820 RepID=A0A9J7DQP0_SPOLT|nr:trypsin, alkaline C-like [Spodoptera litura]
MNVIIIFGALLGSALAVPKNPNRIVGGSPTNIQTYPYMSNMQFRVFGMFWSQACGGSLLTPTAVLSAAHCFYYLTILISLILHQFGETRNPVLENDVAIVRLNNAAVYSNNVQPARIAGANYNLADGTVVTHIGWGTLWSDGPSSQQLMHVDVKIINQKLCAERYAYLKTLPGYGGWPDITDNMLCAGILDVGGKDACQGDSGGPLAHNKDVIVGVTSWGFECAHSFYPGVNARISKYTSWIAATVNV